MREQLNQVWSTVALFSVDLDRFRNEEEVGSALKKCGIPREEIYVTTKVCS